MTDEQTVRNALEYEIEPWTPDPAELIRRGRRGAWVRRGVVAGAVIAVAGSVAGVSMAIGGPQLQQPPVSGGGDSTPSPSVSLPTDASSEEPTATPSTEPTTRPTEPPRTPSLAPRRSERLSSVEPTPSPTERPTEPPVPTVIDSGK